MPVLEQDEFRFVGLFRICRNNRETSVPAHRLMGRDVERGGKLVGHEDRGDVLHVS